MKQKKNEKEGGLILPEPILIKDLKRGPAVFRVHRLF